MFPKLSALHDPQISNLLSMFSLHQRFTFLLRTVPTAAVMSAAVSTDSALLASFREINDITEAELPAGSLRARQAALAARDGGFGVGQLQDTAAVASVASVMASIPLVAARLGFRGSEIADIIEVACREI